MSQFYDILEVSKLPSSCNCFNIESPIILYVCSHSYHSCQNEDNIQSNFFHIELAVGLVHQNNTTVESICI